MNTIKLNTIGLSQIWLNTIGERSIKKNKPESSPPTTDDAPEGYGRFVTADGLTFNAADGNFFVKL